MAILGPQNDDELSSFCKERLMPIYQPLIPENDLILRYRSALTFFECTHLVRITADCWHPNPDLISEIVELMLDKEFDYVSNTIFRSFIEGEDVQAASANAMKWFDHHQTENREHPFSDFDMNERDRIKFVEDGLKCTNILNPKCISTIRTSIDTEQDLERAKKIYEASEAAHKRVG